MYGLRKTVFYNKSFIDNLSIYFHLCFFLKAFLFQITMSRALSPKSHPRDLPPPKDEDLDFDDPPPYLRNNHVRTFWCISKQVRERIMQNRPKLVFFCFHKGYCGFQVDQDPNIARERIENHFRKHPTHRISPQDLPPWDKLAAERRDMRDARRKQSHFGASSSYPGLVRSNSGSPSRGKRERTPSRSQNRSPRDSGSRDWGRSYRDRSISPPFKRRERSRSVSPPFKRRSPNRYPSPYQSPPSRRRERSPPSSYRGRHDTSPDRYTGGRSPQYRGRSRSPSYNPSPLMSVRPKFSSNPIKRTYSAVPGAVGRYNSRMNKDQPSNAQPEMTEWVCTQRGSLPGCTRIFYEQQEYIDHIRQRNMNKRCPDDPKKRSKWVCHTRGSLTGCKKEFHSQREYEDHIWERNRTKSCPKNSDGPRRESSDVISQNFDRARSRSPNLNKWVVKEENYVKKPVSKGQPTEITLDDSPPYIAPSSPLTIPSPPVSPTPASPVSPPCSGQTQLVEADGATSPSPNKTNFTVRDDGILIINSETKPTENIVELEKPRLPKIKIASNIFNHSPEQTAAQSLSPSIMSPPPKRYPTVQRSPSSSPEASFSSSPKPNASLVPPQRNAPPGLLVSKSPSQKSNVRYPAVQRSPTYTSPTNPKSPSQLLSPVPNSSKSPKSLLSPTSLPTTTVLTQKHEQNQNSKKCQDLIQKLNDSKHQELKNIDQQLLKEAEDWIIGNISQSKDNNYKELRHLVKDIKESQAKINKEKEKQIKPKLPECLTKLSDTPNIKESNGAEKFNQEKKNQDEMEMLLDKKKRANFLKSQPKTNNAELKKSQQKLGDIYQRLSKIKKCPIEDRDNLEFNRLMKEADAIMDIVKETKETVEDRKLYDLLCTNIKTMKDHEKIGHATKEKEVSQPNEKLSHSAENKSKNIPEVISNKATKGIKSPTKTKEHTLVDVQGKKNSFKVQRDDEQSEKKKGENIACNFNFW